MCFARYRRNDRSSQQSPWEQLHFRFHRCSHSEWSSLFTTVFIVFVLHSLHPTPMKLHNYLSSRANLVHKRNLGRFLLRILLIDIDSTDPQSSFANIAKRQRSCNTVDSRVVQSSIDQDQHCNFGSPIHKRALYSTNSYRDWHCGWSNEFRVVRRMQGGDWGGGWHC